MKIQEIFVGILFDEVGPKQPVISGCVVVIKTLCFNTFIALQQYKSTYGGC